LRCHPHSQYVFDTASRPSILQVNGGNATLGYGQAFTLEWGPYTTAVGQDGTLETPDTAANDNVYNNVSATLAPDGTPSSTFAVADTYAATDGSDTAGGAVEGTPLPQSARPPVTSVVMVAPSSTTHSFNMNQRVVVLPIEGRDFDAGVVSVRSPPHPFVLPPQWVMVFALNGKTYSQGWWVKLVDTRGEGRVAPH
jgi:hypothetical protein